MKSKILTRIFNDKKLNNIHNFLRNKSYQYDFELASIEDSSIFYILPDELHSFLYPDKFIILYKLRNNELNYLLTISNSSYLYYYKDELEYAIIIDLDNLVKKKSKISNSYFKDDMKLLNYQRYLDKMKDISMQRKMNIIFNMEHMMAYYFYSPQEIIRVAENFRYYSNFYKEFIRVDETYSNDSRFEKYRKMFDPLLLRLKNLFKQNWKLIYQFTNSVLYKAYYKGDFNTDNHFLNSYTKEEHDDLLAEIIKYENQLKLGKGFSNNNI